MEQNIQALTQKQRAFFQTGATRGIGFRLDQLRQLELLIVNNEKQIIEALYADIKKSEHESLATEIAVLIEEIRFNRKNLKAWMKPRRVKTPLFLMPASSSIYREPLGVVLIIGPWNYPFQLAIAPLIAALSAGNCAIIKPSELTPNTSALIARLIKEYFPEELVSVVEGGVPETSILLKQKFDHIFFTGSPAVGKIVMQAAAQNLVPVTLELGGKSPVIVTKNADLDLAAKRVTWGKFSNAGQTCVAPDYVYVHREIADEFQKKVQQRIIAFYGDDPKNSASFGRIVNSKNFDRLEMLVGPNVESLKHDRDRSESYFGPLVLDQVTWDHPVMSEEIFGPILPILLFDDLSEIYKVIQSQEKPLAAYLFSDDKKEQEQFIEQLSFGGGCINDTLTHVASPYLPFGGVGQSGQGAYHGEAGFLTFSHQKSVLKKSKLLDLSFRYPPYSKQSTKWIRRAFGLNNKS